MANEFARHMRSTPTSSERAAWRELRLLRDEGYIFVANIQSVATLQISQS
jgi:very-short-patch-repair endonuclease